MLFLILFYFRVEQLENAQLASLEKYKSRTKEIKANVSKELEEATLDATGYYHYFLFSFLIFFHFFFHLYF